MSQFQPACNYVLMNERGLNVNPNDGGGITNHGISFRFVKSIYADELKACSVFGEVTEDTIRNLTVEQASLIYRTQFWDHAPFEKITNQEHCNYIFDMVVNMGIAPAIKGVQRATWAVMKKWHLLKEDGILGPKTLAAINQCGFLIMPALRAERGGFYRDIVEKNPEKKEFLNGWYNRTYNT